MRFALLAVLALLVAGCTSSRETFLSDGSKGYAITCDNSMNGCLQRAGELCGAKGYEATNREAGVTLTGALLVKCKP